MILPLAVTAILAASPIPQRAADQFDLVCTGNRTGVLSSKVNGVEPFQSELRIDLVAKTWCGGECTQVYDIEAVTGSEIVLNDEVDGPREAHTRVERTTGKFTASTYITTYGLKSGGYSDGLCQRAAFKGMPPPKF